MIPRPGESNQRVRLRDGSEVTIRPILATDRTRLADAFNELSDRSRYLRFQAPMAELTARQLSYLTEVDHHDHEAVVAEAADGNLVGVARFVRVGPEVAEFAIAVADDWQGHGLGTELLDRLVERARQEGVSRFTAVVLAENAEALRLFHQLGPAAHRPTGPQIELEIALPPRTREGEPIRALLRAAAAGAVVPAVTMWRMVADFAHRRAPAPPEPANVIVLDVTTLGDGSTATRVAGALAAARDGCVHLVAAYRPLLSDREETSARLNATAASLRKDGVDVTVHLRVGEPADAVIDVAEESAAALIVVEPPAPGGLMPWRQFSSTDRICARAPCDVLIAR